ncbi:unnamed protein product [Amaranthus hypochondriacus]
MEALKVSKSNLVVYLHPSKTKAVPDSVKQELSSLLFKFSDSFDGVLLAYEVVDVPSKRGKILSGLNPYVGVRVSAKLLLFSPKPDMYLEGKVVKVAEESIHVVVLGFSAAIITQEDIRDEFEFKVKHGKELFRSKLNKRHIIKVGSLIRFSVKSFDEEIIHISGSLISPTTGSIHVLNKNLPEAVLTNRKHRENEGIIDELHSGAVDGGELSDDYHILRKSKRKRGHH